MGWADIATLFGALASVLVALSQLRKDMATLGETGTTRKAQKKRADILKDMILYLALASMSLGITYVADEHSQLLDRYSLPGAEKYEIVSSVTSAMGIAAAIFFCFSLIVLLLLSGTNNRRRKAAKIPASTKQRITKKT